MAKRERIFIIFHWAGLVYGIAILLVFAAGFVVPSGGLVQTLGIALLVMGVVILIQSNENLRGVEILNCRSLPVPAGEEVSFEITVRNTSDRERIGLKVRTDWRFRPRIAAKISILEADETLVVRLRLPTSRRGKFEIPRLWVCSVMPAGLCFEWKTFPAFGDYFVYPKPRGRPLETASLSGPLAGDQSDQGSDDVSGHRSYAPGDLLSRMDWRVFARTGKLVVRTLEENVGGEVALRWSDTQFLEDPEIRLEQLSFWIAQCQRDSRPFVLILDQSQPNLNSSNVSACYQALATFRFDP